MTSIPEWYRAKLEVVDEAHQFALQGLKAELIGKTDEERYPKKKDACSGWKIPWPKKL